jgi:thiol-disulfide isomerase/thioredoxin
LRKIHLLIMLAVVIVTGCGKDEFKPLDGWKGDKGSGTQLIKDAREQDAALVVYFSAPWSNSCRKFEKKTLRTAAVKKALSGFAKLHVDLDQNAKNVYSVKWVPALVFESPLGEKRVFDRGDYPASYLVKKIQTLGAWKDLDDWSSHLVPKPEKPIAILYSAAWSEDAVAYEADGLKKALNVLEERYTLVRLNFAEHEKGLAAKDGVKMAPTLVLPGADGSKVLVAGKQDGDLLAGFVKTLPGYKKDVAPWSSDVTQASEKSLSRGKKPTLVYVDKACDWESYSFLRVNLSLDAAKSGKIAEVLKGFSLVRMQFSPESEFVKKHQLRVADVPCLLVFNMWGQRSKTLRPGVSAKELLNDLKAVENRAKEKVQPETTAGSSEKDGSGSGTKSEPKVEGGQATLAESK